MAKISASRSGKNAPGDKSALSAASDQSALLDDTRRRAMIAEAAYFRAERRGFAPGYELEDWLLSESEVSAQIQSLSLVRRPSGGGDVH